MYFCLSFVNSLPSYCHTLISPKTGSVKMERIPIFVVFSPRGLAQPGASYEVINWKAQVDALFGGYLCHYEVNPDKVEALVQSSSSRVTADEVKVYTDEPGMAVVVGELSQVNAWLLDIEQPSYFSDNMASLNLSEESTVITSYSLYDGLQVFVCQGDITKQCADALVNAANQDLDHSGGVAAALSQAGGPDIQRESDELVKYMGKIPIGEVLVTTGGNLRCKKLLHAVGPVGGKAGDKDRILLEKTVRSILNLSERMAFQSVAIPCISSGVFGVPLTVCCEAIVALTTRFKREAENEIIPGDSVLVEGLPGLQSNAVFFLSLAPFDSDPDGVPVEVK
uniref:Macro domain-containing protein n=1 Tax=Amphilophus citrinellus TaxID=61819 RepID=A0A3Q0SRT1_AMPCI